MKELYFYPTLNEDSAKDYGIEVADFSFMYKDVVLKVDDNARIEFLKTAISTVTNKDAVKSAPSKKKAEAIEEKKAEEVKPAEASEKKEDK